MSPKAAGLAAKKGYKNIKVFINGLPAWKKARQIVEVNPDSVKGWLDQHHVIIDIRPPSEVKKSAVKSAVNLPLSQLLQMNQQFLAKKVSARKANLPGLSDKRAPVVLYSNKFASPEVINAFKTLRNWGYKNVAMLRGGFTGWVASGLPTVSGGASNKIAYTKKLAKGAVAPEEFSRLVNGGKALVLDIRQPNEVAMGKITHALATPLDKLEENLGRIPKDKPVLIYCVNGVRAGIAYNLLQNNGFNKARYLNESIEVNKKGDYCINCN